MFGKPRPPARPPGGLAKPDGFAVWKTRLDTSGAQPLACIRDDAALDPAKSYADFVLVSPDLGHAPAVSVKGDELCVGGVGFADRRVTLLKGLPARPAARPWPPTPTSTSPSATSRPTSASPARA